MTWRTRSEQTHPPVRRSFHTRMAPDVAFRRLTSGLADWWPLDTHAVAMGEASDVVVERHLGGRVYERTRSGGVNLWGTITHWDPPSRLTMSWHPGRAPETAQQLTFSLTPTADGTRVELSHSDWERLGDRAAFVRSTYERGWDPVLARFDGR